ncbi:FecR domain-containing protein [Rhizobium mesosinicum]|uniref:FecR domain-containing protein n=1 Tax=Rhizobium mesosinicum TaxID=335017 RepID=A0ABS7H214_9HYPH|nr:FecR domain-containing protein [Rhizobium mesosinicum]MBW9055841.1 FecR domain-containing protein [Rhizobium mesosinicum]
MKAIPAISFSLFSAALTIGLLPQGAAYAQSASCAISRAANGNQIFRCPGGVNITAERGASFALIDRNRDGSPDSLSLRSKAALVDVDSSQHRGGFQVVTPQAIAAVRGTQWAVDVKGGTTSVLVTRGRVGVRRAAGAAVVLGPGEGVDVMRGTAALTVRTWPAPRVAALLSRLGQ